MAESLTEKAEQIREHFLQKHKDDVDKGLYDERDLTKFRENDKYACAFKRSYETMQDAINYIHEAFKFRKEIGLNDLTEDSFPLEIWESGAAYFHNQDKDGLTILYLQVKQHKKDPEHQPIIRSCFAYMIEQRILRYPDEQMVLLFDLVGAGISHLDMDFIKFIINCFKIYFPGVLGYMLMYEMPWLFNAAWKVIKTMLHEESVKRIKFVTKSDIQEYIDKDQLWEHMGGTDKYVYKYEKSDPENEKGAEGDASTKGRRVTFWDQENGPVFKSFSSDSIKDGTDQGSTSPTSKPPSAMKPTTHSRGQRDSKGDNTYKGRLLTICPAEELEFQMLEGAKEANDSIFLKNSLPYSIAYKVKTTSPEKYRVRPSSGYVKPGTEVEVSISLQQGYHNTVHKDKFLVMAMEVTNESNTSFSELWKAAQKDSIMEHRLRCILVSSKESEESLSTATPSLASPALSDISSKIDTLVECNLKLQKKVNMLVSLQVVMLVVVIVLLVCLIYMWMYPTHSLVPCQTGASNSCSRDGCN